MQQELGQVPTREAPRPLPLSPSRVDNTPGPSARPISISAHFPPSAAQVIQVQGSSRSSSSGTRPLARPLSNPAPRSESMPARTFKAHSKPERVVSDGARPSTTHSQIALSSQATSRRTSYPTSSEDIIDLTSDPPEEPGGAPVPATRKPHSSPNPHSSSATISPGSSIEQQESASKVAGTKRLRLGMGRTAVGYSNKRFKMPALAPGT